MDQIEPLGALQTHVLDSIPPSSVRTLDDVISIIRHEIKPLMGTTDLIMIPRGVIDRSYFCLHQRGLMKATNSPLNGNFHTHYAACLISDGNTKTETLAASAEDLATATYDILSADGEHDFHEIFDKNYSGSWKKDAILDFLGAGLRADHPASSDKTPYRNPQMDRDCLIANGLSGVRAFMHYYDMHMRSAPNKDQKTNLLFPFGREVQRTTKNVVGISWEQFDMGFIKTNVWHGRDIRTADTRRPEEGVFLTEEMEKHLA